MTFVDDEQVLTAMPTGDDFGEFPTRRTVVRMARAVRPLPEAVARFKRGLRLLNGAAQSGKREQRRSAGCFLHNGHLTLNFDQMVRLDAFGQVCGAVLRPAPFVNGLRGHDHFAVFAFWTLDDVLAE